MDFGIIEIDLCGFHFGFGQRDRGFGLFHIGDGLIVFLGAHRFGADQSPVPPGQGGGGLKLRHGVLQVGPGPLVVGVVPGGIDLVQLLIFFDEAALFEQPGLDDAAYLGPDLGGPVRFDPAGKLVGQGDPLRARRDVPGFGGGSAGFGPRPAAGFGLRVLAVAGAKNGDTRKKQ